MRSSSSTPRLDAELLLAHILGWPRTRLLAEGNDVLDDKQVAAFQALVTRRAEGEPVAYLIGHREFYGLELLVDRRVLVPRPETEQLVELALALGRQIIDDRRPTTEDNTLIHLPARFLSLPKGSPPKGPSSDITIADIGTGSGAIAIALATHLPNARIYATDISAEALAVAAANVARHNLAEQVMLLHGDLLTPVPEPVDLIVSNPPYTLLDAIEEPVRRYEPHLALDGGPGGLALYERLLAQAPGRLRNGGAILLEIGAEQGVAVSELAQAAFPGAAIGIYQDLAGLDRVVTIQPPAYTPGDRKPGDAGTIVQARNDDV